MSPETRESMDKARDSVEKAAYAALGAPVAAVKALSARVSDLRDAVRSSSKDMSEDLTREMNEWIAEGEKVIERAMKRMRSSEVVDEVRSRATEARRAAEAGIEKARGGLDRGLDVVAPDEELTVVNGIGPSYADQLREVGVTGIAGFIDRTGTSSGIDELAAATDISAATIEGWRHQVELTRVDGIGEAHEMLLHRGGVWTLSQLAECEPATLVEDLHGIDMPDTPEHIPSADTVEQWIGEAKQLS
jgi:predicted flap endonuclease-1-like 5' DNA nuclease